MYWEGDPEECDCDSAMKPTCVCAAIEASRLAARKAEDGGSQKGVIIGGVVAAAVVICVVSIGAWRRRLCCFATQGRPGAVHQDAPQPSHAAPPPGSAPSAPQWPPVGPQGAQQHIQLPTYPAASSSAGPPPPGPVVMGIPKY